MTNRDEDEELRTELETVAARCGCDVLHMSFVAGRLQVILDKSEGVTLEDCARVSREASAILDVLDFGSSRYTLEVSSPGLDREFFEDTDYERFAGEMVKVTWLDPQTGARRTDVGELMTFHADPDSRGSIELKTDSEQLTIQLANVAKTRLEPVV